MSRHERMMRRTRRRFLAHWCRRRTRLSRLLKWFYDYASKTPFDFQDLIDAAQILTGKRISE